MIVMKNIVMYIVFFAVCSIILYLFKMTWIEIALTSIIATVIYAIVIQKIWLQ